MSNFNDCLERNRTSVTDLHKTDELSRDLGHYALLSCWIHDRICPSTGFQCYTFSFCDVSFETTSCTLKSHFFSFSFSIILKR